MSNYTVCRYNQTPLGIVTQYMAIDGSFYIALHSSLVPRLPTKQDAVCFFNQHAFKHHKLAKGSFVLGPRGGIYPIK